MRGCKRVAEPEVLHGRDNERKHGKRGKRASVGMDECESVEQQHEHVQTGDGLRRSKRVAGRMMTGAEGDSQHAHKRGKHESVSAFVDVSIVPWRDK